MVLGGGQGSLVAAAAAGGRPPTPATAYQPRQTCPENLPWQRHATHLIEIKYCEDTRPEQQLQAAPAQHGCLRRSIAGDHVLHVILLGVGGVIYIPHTLVPLKSLGLDWQRVKKLALKLHAHSVHRAYKLVQTRRSLEHSQVSSWMSCKSHLSQCPSWIANSQSQLSGYGHASENEQCYEAPAGIQTYRKTC